ncbi:MAG: class I SAM-dependent methyltransferase [Planctomycetes bacterium]|nr:class I SAM-dependent methyltransferase [Planctomycetota bacterium]
MSEPDPTIADGARPMRPGLGARVRDWIAPLVRRKAERFVLPEHERFPLEQRFEPIPIPSPDELFADLRSDETRSSPRALREAPTIQPPCPGCGRIDGFSILYTELPNIDTRDSAIVECPTCSYVFLSPRQRELSDSWWNAETYVTDCLIPRMRKEKQIDAQGRFDPNRNWILQRAIAYGLEAIAEDLPRRVLDVGCSFGGLVHALRCAGWDTTGIEPSEHVARLGRTLGNDIRIGTHDALREHDDVPCIVMTEVLEHCFDPREAIRAAYRALAPGGLFFVSVPNFDGRTRKQMGKAWGEFVSDHFSHFTGTTLGRMLVDEGFVNVKLLTTEGFPILVTPLPGPAIRAMQARQPWDTWSWITEEHSGAALYAWAIKPR